MLWPVTLGNTMSSLQEQLIEEVSKALSGADVEVISSDDVHFFMTVTWPEFKGQSMLEQHRKVYDALSDHMKNTVHALSLHTRAG